MEPSPDETVTGAAYGGSRLTGDLEAPGEYAFDGRGELATQPGAAPEQAPEDAESSAPIEEQGDWMTEVLAQLVRAETTLGNEEAGQAVMRSVLREDLHLEPVDVPMDADALRAHPACSAVRLVAGRPIERRRHAGSRPTDGGRSLILNGHIDVVSPEPSGAVGRARPFGADRDGEWMIGSGAADMKCGLAAIVGAVRGLRSLGLTPRAPVTIESVLEEECSGNGTLQTLLAGYTAEAAVIAEPFGAAITTSQVGVLWFSVRITGVPGHAAEGRNATNAIEREPAVIGALRGLESDLNAAPPAPVRPFAHPINLNVGTIRGGDWPSTVPGECVTGYRIALYPDMRVGRPAERGSKRVVAEATADQPGSAEVHYNGFASHGYELADDHDLVTTLAGSFARQAGVPPALVATTGTTDAPVFGNVAGIPAVCFGPYAEAAHGVGERVYLPSVIQTAQVMGLFIRDWCGLSR